VLCALPAEFGIIVLTIFKNNLVSDII